jgi:hypothetical protein
MDFSSPLYKPANDVHWQFGPRWSRSPRARKNVGSNIDQRFSFKLELEYVIIILLLLLLSSSSLSYSVRYCISVTRIG